MIYNFKEMISHPFTIQSTHIYSTFATCQDSASWLEINKETDVIPLLKKLIV